MTKKAVCEMCGLHSAKAIERHHIIPRTDPRCTDEPINIASICGSCHNEVHAGEKIIEGRYLTSSGVKVIWHKSGEPFIVREGVILLPSGMAEIRD